MATAVAPGLPWLLLWPCEGEAAVGRGLASLLGLVQFAVLGINAVSRQVVQNLELSRRTTTSSTNSPRAGAVESAVLLSGGVCLGSGGGRLDDCPGSQAAARGRGESGVRIGKEM